MERACNFCQWRNAMMAKHLREMQKSEREHQKWTQHPPVTQKHGTTGPDQ